MGERMEKEDGDDQSNRLFFEQLCKKRDLMVVRGLDFLSLIRGLDWVRHELILG